MKILVAGWDSGGGVEAVQTVVGRAVARGHQVRVLGTEGLRSRFESAGATLLRYRYAPDNDMSKPETDLVKDWQTRNPVSQWRRVRDRELCGPARPDGPGGPGPGLLQPQLRLRVRLGAGQCALRRAPARRRSGRRFRRVAGR